jgi:hypothetical protein
VPPPGVPEDPPRFALMDEEAGARDAGIELVVGDGRRVCIRRGVHE